MSYLALALASVSNFILGGIWYSILFGKLWQKNVGTTSEQIQSQSSLPYGIAFICSLLAAVGFNIIVSNSVSLMHNIILALIIGFLIATSLCINYQFSGKKTSILLIDSGYHIARFLIYAFIFWFVR